MNWILFDDDSWNTLLPLTFTRPVAKIRIGILTISEKWERLLNQKISFLTAAYLSEKYPLVKEKENLLINGSVLPVGSLLDEIKTLKEGEVLVQGDKIIAARLSEAQLDSFDYHDLKPYSKVEAKSRIVAIQFPWQIFQFNSEALIADFQVLTEGRKSIYLSPTNRFYRTDNIFLEEGAKVEFATLNSKEGPIYIGKDAEIMEGAVVRGPLALCDHSVIKVSAKIYEGTTIGPHCKVGGEVGNSVIFGYTNKAHDGYLGNAVLGEWCNLGADSNNSNLKNNYADIRLWSYPENKFINTGLQFCGLIMGDNSKCGINTMFNTGTVVGVNANIFGSGFPRNFIPDFSWGGAQGFTTYSLNTACEVAQRVMIRRNIQFDETEKKILEHIFEITQKYRTF